MPFLLLLLLMLACLQFEWQNKLGEGKDATLLAEESVLLTFLAMSCVVAAAALLARWTCREPRRPARPRRSFSVTAACHGASVWSIRRLRCEPGGAGLGLDGAARLRVYSTGRPVQPGRCDAGCGLSFWPLSLPPWSCPGPVSTMWIVSCTTAPGASARRSPSGAAGLTSASRSGRTWRVILPPLMLLVITQGLLRSFPELQTDPYFQCFSYALLALILIGMPWILRLVLGLRALPDGPLRRQLEQAAQRLGFRCSNVLIWPTRGSVANAMVVGLLPRLRYVVLTDRLVAELAPEEVEAVFGHEVGHVKHHHMLYYLGFLLISLGVVAGVWAVIFGSIQDSPMWSLVPFFGLYVFVVFGFLSRRCERQADIFGCRAVSCAMPDCSGHEMQTELPLGGAGLCRTGIQTFIGALEKVAQLNGISRSKPGWLNSWQHSTIARRVEFLQHILVDPASSRASSAGSLW